MTIEDAGLFVIVLGADGAGFADYHHCPSASDAIRMRR
jgi:hypothetical protein